MSTPAPQSGPPRPLPAPHAADHLSGPTEALEGAEQAAPSASHLARLALRYLIQAGLQPTPAHFAMAWQAVGGADASIDEAARLQADADRARKLSHELIEIVRSLCDSIEVSLPDESWLSGQIGAIRAALTDGGDRRALSAVRVLLQGALSAQRQIGQERQQAVNALRDLLPDVIAQMSRLGSQSGDFGDRLSTHLDTIGRASSLEAIAVGLRQLTDEARQMGEVVGEASDRLSASAREARELESEVERLERELARTSEQLLTDHLTQASNRAGLEQAFDRAAHWMSQARTDLSIALIDVDDFKKVNDVLGHAAGDATLRYLADLLRRQVRAGDTVARYGGEEFVVLMPGMNAEQARSLLVRVQRELTREVYLHGNDRIFITFSAGATQVEPRETLEQSLQRADEAMYRSKRAGKNCVTVA